MSQPEAIAEVPNGKIEVLAAVNGATACASVMNGQRGSGRVFAEERLRELGELSRVLLQRPELKREPAAVALGFWLRLANLGPILHRHGAIQDAGVVLVPAGLVFHIAPANVDTMFVYSWALSYLAGNANLVRLSTEQTPLAVAILHCIRERMEAAPRLWSDEVFVTYQHNDGVTALISQACDCRIVWGGDETVRRIRAVPLNPHASERVFPSKVSAAVFNAAAFVAADTADRKEAVMRLLADLTPFNQQACSSPHVVYWLGSTADSASAMAQFDASLAAIRSDAADIGAAVRRINKVFSLAATGTSDWSVFSLHPDVWTLRQAAGAAVVPTPGDGVITYQAILTLEAMSSQLGPAHQTVTHWGLDQDAIRQIAAAAGARGVDRIVPVGKALVFDHLWDGGDLLDEFTRKVRLWA